MTSAEPEEVTEWVEPPHTAAPHKLDQYLCRSPWYYPAVFGGSVAIFAALYGFACLRPLERAVLLVGLGTSFGIVLTLLATAWGAAVAFADDVRRGIWFAICPPFVVYFAVVRWRWMAQPAVLFLCGLGLSLAAIYGGLGLLERVGQDPAASGPETSSRAGR